MLQQPLATHFLPAKLPLSLSCATSWLETLMLRQPPVMRFLPGKPPLSLSCATSSLEMQRQPAIRRRPAMVIDR